MSKPSEFYLGVLDLFGVVLPGAIAAAILVPRVSPAILGTLIAKPTTDTGIWAAFLVSSYFLGHLVFLVGSYIDPLYDHIRKRRNPYTNESAYQRATAIRDSLIDASEQKCLNTFQWSRSVLVARCPAAAEDIHRLEADAKFFRSLLVICLLTAGVCIFEHRWLAGAISIAVMIPCFARYYERRLKSTTQAYVHVVTHYRLGGLSSKPDAG